MSGKPENLKPFEKGTSGNPGGRTKQDLEIEAHAKLHAKQAIDVAVAIMLSEAQEAGDRLRAAQFIVERACGKPRSQVTLEGGEQPIGVQVVSSEPLTAEAWASKFQPSK